MYKLLNRSAEKQQASHSISACPEALMTVKKASSTPSHQTKCCCQTSYVIVTPRRITEFRLQMVDSKQRVASAQN